MMRPSTARRKPVRCVKGSLAFPTWPGMPIWHFARNVVVNLKPVCNWISLNALLLPICVMLPNRGVIGLPRRVRLEISVVTDHAQITEQVYCSSTRQTDADITKPLPQYP